MSRTGEVTERRSISGIRGTAETLTRQKAADYTRAFATCLRRFHTGNTVVVGIDTRPTSAGYGACVIDSLRDAGWDVIDVGVVGTPTLQIAISKLSAAGGVAVTASHNPVEYNGIKFLQNRHGYGVFLDKEQVNELFAIYDAGEFDTRRRGECHNVADLTADFDDPPYTAEYLDRNRIDLSVDNHLILDHHLHRVFSAMGRELDRIRGMNFRVAMDCCGGAGIPIDYVLLDYLYCRLKRVNGRPGEFSRPIEPTPANLAGLCNDLERDSEDYDAAFVTDCDNDRCVIVGRNPETGAYVPLEEDYTFAIAVDQVLANAPHGSTVVTNWSTSQTLYDVASSHNANLRRAPTGEVYTASEALQYRAAIAGEGSCAGVIDPRVGLGRDCLVAMWHILGALARTSAGLVSIAEALPRYYRVRQDHPCNLPLEQTAGLLEVLQVHYARKDAIHFISREDGLVVCFNDQSRIHIRNSNTEPILRVRSEARTEPEARALIDEARSVIAGHAK